MTTESKEVWTSEYEDAWYVGYITKYDEHFWFVKLEGGDVRYRVFCHRNVVAEDFDTGVIGTRVRLRLRPNRKANSLPWEALEAVIEPKDLAAQNADGGIENGNTTGA
jgi:hypothetical protein